jgi:YgiT-type zinc finger domain-containing protein
MFPEDAPYPSRLVPLGTRFQEKEKPLKCPVCKQGETREGTATVTLERDDVILVFKKVPAEVCEVCGEEYIDEQTTARLLAAAEEAVRAGVQVDIREYVAA